MFSKETKETLIKVGLIVLEIVFLGVVTLFSKKFGLKVHYA